MLKLEQIKLFGFIATLSAFSSATVLANHVDGVDCDVTQRDSTSWVARVHVCASHARASYLRENEEFDQLRPQFLSLVGRYSARVRMDLDTELEPLIKVANELVEKLEWRTKPIDPADSHDSSCLEMSDKNLAKGHLDLRRDFRGDGTTCLEWLAGRASTIRGARKEVLRDVERFEEYVLGVENLERGLRIVDSWRARGLEDRAQRVRKLEEALVEAKRNLTNVRPEHYAQ